jgi:hypothetical protein
MPRRSLISTQAVLLVVLMMSGATALAQSPFEHCADLYELWTRYEWHFTLHSSQKARADMALERDCRGGGYARGVEELQKLLRRGLIPYPTDDAGGNDTTVIPSEAGDLSFCREALP